MYKYIRHFQTVLRGSMSEPPFRANLLFGHAQCSNKRTTFPGSTAKETHNFMLGEQEIGQWTKHGVSIKDGPFFIRRQWGDSYRYRNF